MSARSSLAPFPRYMAKPDPEILAAASKSMRPCFSASWTWSSGSAISGLSPQILTSGLSSSSLPIGQPG